MQFFERNTWNHRTKKLLRIITIKYGKKGGFETAEEAEKAYQEHIKEFDRKMNMTFLEVDKEVTLKKLLTLLVCEYLFRKSTVNYPIFSILCAIWNAIT